MGIKADLIVKRKELEAKQGKLAKIFADSKDGNDYDFLKSKDLEGDMKARVSEVRKKNEELDALTIEVEGLVAALKASDRKIGSDEPRVEHPDKEHEFKTLGRQFTESNAFKNFHGGDSPSVKIDVDLKTLFQTSAGWAPESVRTGKVVEYATRPIQVIDIIPPGNTNDASIVYMEETTFTNAAAEAAEAGTYAEAALVLTERTSAVRKVAVFIPVTDEQLEDEAQAQSYLDNRLMFMIRQRLDGQILTGSGVAPNLTGILNVSGIQTQAKGADPTPDAVYKAITKVRVTGRAIPNVVVMHPNDWQDIRLLRTADGIYIWGNPSEAGPERIWGLAVVQTDAETENTGLVGDFANFIQLFEKRGIEVKISNSHSTYFVEGKQAVRADIRVALPTYRPAAFCTVTGI